MRKLSLIIFIANLLAFNNYAQEVRLLIAATSDLHGAIFPDRSSDGSYKGRSMANISTLISGLRQDYPDRLILLDNGDLIQGDPASYYYNFISTTDTHLFVRAL
ncbi:MAG: bifunctional metallophosphatase/5'-nucleotidase, partial [Bacteroidales bacterium]|nr:bifunctional metallophosphatase/5'-nucleotidase [Bacteroidales bacterium]